MKAVVVRAFGPVEHASVTELPDPMAGPDDVIIDVEAAETNFPDILVMEGRYQVKPPLPFVPGKAAAGRVAALGANVRGFKVGDRVAAQVEYGAYASKLCAPARSCFSVPSSISAVEAAALGLTYQTAWFALTDRGQLTKGESVLVLGATGGVGIAAMQLAKALGARLVFGATRGPDKAAIARRAGADHVIDLAQGDIRDRLRDEVRKHAPDGVDIVIDPVGGAATEAALRALAWRGRLVVVGFAAGDIPTVRANYLLVKNITVSGLQWSDYRDRAPEQVARAQAEIFRLREAGKLSPVISDVLPLESFATALARLRDGKAEGKIILKV